MRASGHSQGVEESLIKVCWWECVGGSVLCGAQCVTGSLLTVCLGHSGNLDDRSTVFRRK